MLFRSSRPRKGSPKGRFQTQCLLRCYLKILEERSEPPTPQRSGRAGEEKGRGKEGKGGDAMRGRKGKKKKKEKASDSLPLQGSSEVGSRDPKRSRFCQRFGGSWQLTGFQAAHVQSVSGRLAGREWAPCLLSMCCGLYNPHLISPSQYPSKVALTPLYR